MRRPAEMATIFINRFNDKIVIQMTHRTTTAIGVVGENHIAFFNDAFKSFHEAVNKRTELSNNHFAIDIGNHRKGVALFTNAR